MELRSDESHSCIQHRGRADDSANFASRFTLTLRIFQWRTFVKSKRDANINFVQFTARKRAHTHTQEKYKFDLERKDLTLFKRHGFFIVKGTAKQSSQVDFRC